MNRATRPADAGKFTRAFLCMAGMTVSSGCGSPARPTPGDGGAAARHTGLSRSLLHRASAGPLVVAHRGNSSAFPENTLPAFASALALGADMVELDFQVTADGVLVCIHDDTLDRTTDSGKALGRRKARVDSVDSATVAGLDAGAWKGSAWRGTRIPTLAEALDAIQADAIAMIERKSGPARTLVELLQARGLVDAVLVQSFDWDWLAEVHRLEPRLTLGALGEDPITPATIERVADLRVSLVHWSHSTLRLCDIAELTQLGYLVCTYTVDSELELLGSIQAGLHAVTTNVPERLLRLRAR